MRFGSLFAGIGGFDLGFESAGLQCAWQVEIDPWCRRVLTKHWPTVPKFEDVREFAIEADESLKVDVICGGFPCQDISNAGKREGIDGKRSGLWSEYARIVGVLRPRFVVVENVRALVGRGLSRVLMDLARLRYDAEWQIVSAAAFGAPHIRERLFLVAYSTCPRDRPVSARPGAEGEGETNSDRGRDGMAADAESVGRGARRLPIRTPAVNSIFGLSGQDAADSSSLRERESADEADTVATRGHTREELGGRGWWSVEPDVGRVAHGVPKRVDRLRGLGNSVVPQVAEWIGRRLMDAAQS
jgi:DNA (cytosine-5)-methyltransferase 1